MGKEIILFIWYHHSNEILFQVNILDSPIVSEEIIHHIQVCDLDKTCQLVLDWCQEGGLHGIDNLFFERLVNGGIMSEQKLVLTEALCPECLFLRGIQCRGLVAQIVGGVQTHGPSGQGKIPQPLLIPGGCGAPRQGLMIWMLCWS